MKCFIVFAAVAAVASAGIIAAPYSTLVRAPAYDSAVIKSERLGGNFAYSTIESHAYAHHTPIIQHVATPYAVSYSAPAAVAAYPGYYPGLYAHPGFFAPQVVAAAPVADAVAAPVAEVAAPLIPVAPEAPKAEEAIVEEAAAAPTEAPAAPVEAVAESTAAPTDAAPAASNDDTVAVEAA